MPRALAVVAFAALLATLAVAVTTKVVEKDLGNGMKSYRALVRRAPHVKPDSTSTSSGDGVIEQPETFMVVVNNRCACQLTLVGESVGPGTWNVAPPQILNAVNGFEARVAQFSANLTAYVVYACSSWPAGAQNLTFSRQEEAGGLWYGFTLHASATFETVYVARTTLVTIQFGSSSAVVC